MKWWDWMPWSLLLNAEFKVIFFTLSFHFLQEAFQFRFALCRKGGVICKSEVTDVSPSCLESSCASSSLVISHDVLTLHVSKINRVTTYSLEALLSILIQSVVPYLVLTVASWPTFGYLMQQADSLEKTLIWNSHLFKNFLPFVVIHTVKGFSVVNEAEVDFFLEYI